MPVKNAKRLRKNPTEAEKRLWQSLRQRQLNGHYIRRQAAIGPYVADFVCFKKRLIVEVDGGQYALKTQHDEKRTQWLQGEGFRIIRFWNHDVLGNPEGVLISILEALNEAPPPMVRLARRARGPSAKGPHRSSPIKGEGISCGFLKLSPSYLVGEFEHIAFEA